MDGRIIKAAIKMAGKTQAEVADLIGLSREHFGRLLKGDVEVAYVEKIRKAGVEIDVTKIDIEAKPVPYYDVDAHAGNVTIFAEDGKEYVAQYINVPAFSDCEMFIGVSGNSMYPKYCAGELVALKKITDWDVIPYNEPYLVVTKEQRLLKYIRKGKDKDHWTLASEHPDYGPFDIAKKKVLYLYIVKGKISKNII